MIKINFIILNKLINLLFNIFYNFNHFYITWRASTNPAIKEDS